MIAHLTIDQIESYVARKLSRPDLAHVHKHLFDCEHCYQWFLNRFEANREWPIEIDLDELSNLNGWHLQDEELRAYTEGKMEMLDLDFASLHLEKCEWCREDLASFLEFNDKLSYYISKRHSPIKLPPALNRYLLDIGNLSRPLRMAGASAFALMLLSLATILWLFSGTKPAGESASFSGRVADETHSLTKAPPSSDTTSSVTTEAPAASAPPARQATGSGEISPTPVKGPTKMDLLAKDLTKPRVIDLFDQSSVVLRGNGGGDEFFNVTSPYCTLIREDQPAFHWKTLSGASSYVVSVYDKDLRLVVTSEPLTVTRWIIPVQLRRDEIYTWIVIAHKDGKEIVAPSLPARAEFKIIGQTDLTALNHRLKQASSELARGILYAEAGLLDDAQRQIQSHLAIIPADEGPKRLLRTMQWWRKN